jgi:aminoglycoside 6'-N-acetyltransferase I
MSGCMDAMITVRPANQADAASWLQLRCALWPEGSAAEHRREIEEFFAGHAPEPNAVFLAEDRRGRIIGMAELSIRPCAEGCLTNKVAYLEGWYVVPDARRQGIGCALVAAAEEWGRLRGCQEFASDARADDEASAVAHRRVGFTEVGVFRCFRKELRNAAQQQVPPDAAAEPAH